MPEKTKGSTLEKFVKDVQRAGVPLAAVESADQNATVAAIAKAVNGGGAIAKIRWDYVRGVEAVEDTEKARLVVGYFTAAGVGDVTVNNPVSLLDIARKLPDGVVIFMVNAHLWIEGDNGAAARQAVHNLRDAFKATGNVLYMLAPHFRFAPELSGDVEVYSEQLPTREELGEMVGDLCEQGEIPLTAKSKADAVDGLIGLSHFRAEQVAALSARQTGLDIEVLWERKKQAIGQTPGLSIDSDSFTFADIGGHERVKEFGRLLFSGPKPPTVIVRVEEIEKVMGGASGDTSGTSQDALQVLLSGMEDNDFAGVIAYGPPGSGKSLFSKSLANTFEKPCINLDLNATKDSLVGSSEARVRQAFGTIKAIAGKGGAFFVATANKLGTVPPELRRRFRYGVWMFDLPTRDEREAVWEINLKQFGITGERAKRDGIDDAGFSGADIRSICELAWRTGTSLAAAMGFIVLSKASPEAIEECRKSAEGRFMSSAYAGMYKMPSPEAPVVVKPNVRRKLALAE